MRTHIREHYKSEMLRKGEWRQQQEKTKGPPDFISHRCTAPPGEERLSGVSASKE